MKIKSYVVNEWIEGLGAGKRLLNAVNGEEIGTVSAEGISVEMMLTHAREKGGPALRKMSFQERGRMLKSLALYLTEKKSNYYPISYKTGATKTDSWIDIDGGIGTLFAYSSLRRKLPNQSYCLDGDLAPLSKSNTFIGHHILTPKKGVAIHINAFNFPVWGMLEKISVNLLAGVPAIVKPATLSCYLAQAVVKDMIDSGILPEGSLQLICGSIGDLFDHLQNQDVVTFTGSASTGRKLKVHPRIISESIPFNMEADSLNCSVLGHDARPGTPDFDIFIKEVHREMTAKCGQKCTAIRRVIVPEEYIDAVHTALAARLDKTIIGDPILEEVRMGSLAGIEQLDEVREKVAKLSQLTPIIYGNPVSVQVKGEKTQNGAFISPMIMLNDQPFSKTASHDVEIFGPVCTIMPYKNVDEAVALAQMGKGSLVSSIVTSDTNTARTFVIEAGAYHGRILILNEACAKESTGHGSPMPLLTHGGPGRAGGGEEMGGLRGIKHYMQRTAIQGSPNMITAVTEQFQPGASGRESEIHLFRKHFEELQVGDQWITARHTVTETDITNFANLSGDHFYAHMDATSLEGTIFTGRVAHGYYILSKAAGLFVDAKKGPVLLNYGLDECRFIKPVYPGMTIGVKLTVKEKTDQEKKNSDDIAKGIVKWHVDVYDETGESVAIASILTMVKKLNDL
ncbi:MAG: phenylacetic acid degradation bifunctional protein PaaZ [Saprospiraceae bacterium]|nr:phenylacetic acid degradation bifunctional protein PaaZ [Saprospiraceae bacterium]HMW38172.1 phenylacetic acid degradation bifunctional protein PaaZ [Saprospiraceae bacterium]HMX87697.1 phenylacetic acid degradation bifunctional protein PaaZ [Saprospiraceae bacterium]HMZ39512.1 phenylacetic acid degradation bifunctional protein PaaZ [Saprospiraceae bacterium]HNA63115.1 phenylacetic acid degradation bifunctional protein PaaZ [Saprospiraceae bacterium]